METYTLKLSPQQVQIIGEVLAQAPYKMVAEIISVIQLQVTAQNNAPITGNGKAEKIDATAS